MGDEIDPYRIALLVTQSNFFEVIQSNFFIDI